MSFTLRKLTLRDWLYIFVWLTIAIFCLYIAEIIQHATSKNVLQQIASIVGITGILSIVLRRQTMIEIVDLVSEKTNVAKNLLDSGIFFVSSQIGDFDFKKEIQKCGAYIDINVIYASTWLKDHLPYLISFARERNRQIRICFLDPECEAVKLLEEKFQEGDLKEEDRRVHPRRIEKFSKPE